MGDTLSETALAFAPPEARARATAAGQPCDRISVRDDVRAVEIGAFGAERGVTQRLRFNVVLEVAPHDAAAGDDVDRVISYDTITDAITAELARERLNLLETLAERIADRCLADPRALRAFVRVEKLDRGSGALGVEIVRARAAAEPVAEARAATAARVVYLPPEVMGGPEGPDWIAALGAHPGPLVLCLGPALPEPAATSEAGLRAGLLSIDQAAWRLAERAPGLAVVGSRTELDWALARGKGAIWAPVKMVLDARARPGADASAPERLAAWLAAELGAPLALAGDGPAAEGAIRLRHPADLAPSPSS
ncbi:dihydroneopterin aldolase [Amaricoccus solimangrovi]|uniref:dihydroneopterin aldolase n=1 Tax=Amaricoccus solimangrovi TaxID=2589815 RepID=UPI0015E31F8A|nr:dihydroneopterin aldolase [Amaricoccus solimangrovi]